MLWRVLPIIKSKEQSARRAGRSKRESSAKNGSDGRTPTIIRAMETVFRSTHDREMTADDRPQFRLPFPTEARIRNVTSG